MCINSAVLVSIILVLLFLLYTRQPREHMQNIPISKMTDDDIDKLRQFMENAVRRGQFYGDFRRMYPYEITPWQYNAMTLKRRLGELDILAIKNILQNT
jgi:hypothetical protein